MLHPDASGMKHGTRETHENYLGFVLDDVMPREYDTPDRSSLLGFDLVRKTGVPRGNGRSVRSQSSLDTNNSGLVAGARTRQIRWRIG